MKKYNCLIISFIIFNSSVIAQNTTQYKWGSKPPLVVECDRFGVSVYQDGNKKKIPVDPHSYFWITSKLNADTVIATAGLFGKIVNGKVEINEPEKYWHYNVKSSPSNDLTANRTKEAAITPAQLYENRQYFLVPVSALGTADAIPVFAKGLKSGNLTIGAASIPFKLRIHNFDFAKDLNIGSVIGLNIRTHRTKNNYINYLFNISVSVNDIDKLSARNVPDDQLPAKNIAALTLAGGIVWQFGKGQVGLLYGFDFMSHNNWTKYRWVYNKMPWIGVGFGINLFQKEDLNAGPGDEISNYKKRKGRSVAPITVSKN